MTDAGVDQARPTIARGWIGEPDTDAAHLVLVHGYACDEKEMLQDAQKLAPHLPGVNVRLSSLRGWNTAQSGGNGYEWIGPGPGIGHPSPDLEDSAQRLVRTVEEIGDGPVILMGFSQGAAMSSEVLRRRPDLVAGLVALSGYTLLPPRPADEVLARDLAAGNGKPAFLGYDERDPVIAASALEWTAQFLRSHTDLTEERFPELGHRISRSQMPAIAEFLKPLVNKAA